MSFFAPGLNVAWELIYTLSDIFLEAHGPPAGIKLAQAVANAARAKWESAKKERHA